VKIFIPLDLLGKNRNKSIDTIFRNHCHDLLWLVYDKKLKMMSMIEGLYITSEIFFILMITQLEEMRAKRCSPVALEQWRSG